MGYNPTIWKEKGMETSKKVSGLNNLETVYEKSIDYMTNFAHIDIYTIAEADARYYRTPSHPSGRSDTGHGCNIDAAKLDGMTLAEILVAALPSGSIGMWGAGAVPTGFYECTGLNSTPDMQNYIPKGAGGGITPGQTGGSNTPTPTAGSFNSPNHLLTDNEIPKHQHTYSDVTNLSAGYAWSAYSNFYKNSGDAYKTTDKIYPGGYSSRTTHNHPGCAFTWSGYLNDQGVHQGTGTLDIRPACRAVKFIMRG